MQKRERVDLSVFVGKIETLCEYLESNPDVNLSRLRDEKRNSVLHITAYENKFEMMRIIVDHVEKVAQNRPIDANVRYPAQQSSVRELVQDLINDKNVQGFTALHYASLRGNFTMMNFLERRGGSIFIVTKSRLNLVHSAAQGDALSSILYLQSRFRSYFNDKDYSQSTALHWACYFGSESVVEFLLAQPEVLINEKDIDGQTPLHIAVLNCRPAIVKRLLIKGADRKLTNKRQQTPMQIAESSQFTAIIKMLDNRYTCSDNCMFYYNKKRKYQPQFRSCSKPLLFIILFIYVVGGTHLLYTPKFPMLYVYISAGVHVAILLLYLTLLIRAPLRNPKQYKALMENLPICSECRDSRESRMHHCNICSRCVPQYDHHCPWINGCVGKHNVKRFIFFLVLLLVLMLENSFLEIVGIFQLQFAFESFNYFGLHTGVHEYFAIAYRVILGVGLGVVFIFFLLSLGLLCNQIKNVCSNTTTYQRSFQGYRKVIEE